MRSAWKVVAWRRFEATPDAVWAALGFDAQQVLASGGPFGSVQALGAGAWTLDPPARARRVALGCDQRIRVERATGDRSRLVVETLVARSGWGAALRARLAAMAAGRASMAALRALSLPGDPAPGLRTLALPPAMAGHADDALGTLLPVAGGAPREPSA
ncbi:MAG: hypothetical protein RLZZ383_1309 [Pseudomonadota bacterium]|jgi:hypothetical protein